MNLFFVLPITRTAAANPETIAQFVAPTNQRIALHRIEYVPKGSTGESAPFVIEVVIQDGAGTSSDASGNLQKRPPYAAETIQTTARKTFTAEPSTNTRVDAFGSHRQAPLSWEPANGPIVVEGGDRLGIRHVGVTGVEADYVFHMEE